MNKREVRDLRIALEEALETVGERFDLDIKVRGIQYGEDNFHCKIEGLEKGAESLDAQYYRFRATSNMPMLGSKILLQGTEFTVIGWRKRANKYPILIEDNTGGKYKVSVSQLLNASVLD